MVTVHSPVVLVQANVHPVNVDVASFGVAIRVTSVPWRNGLMHCPTRQSWLPLVSAGRLVMVPSPLPSWRRLRLSGFRLNTGVKVKSPEGMFIRHGLLVLTQLSLPPTQPANVDVALSGLAVNCR